MCGADRGLPRQLRATGDRARAERRLRPDALRTRRCALGGPPWRRGRPDRRRRARRPGRRAHVDAPRHGIATVGLALAAAAHSKQLLFWALVLFGVGSAVVPIAGTGALFRAYPAARRGWALGVRQTAVPLGGAIAAVLFPSLTRSAGVIDAGRLGGGGRRRVALVRARRHRQPLGAADGRRSFATILRAPGVITLLAVAACYIVVLQALLAFLVPAVREAGHWSSRPRSPTSPSISRRWSRASPGARVADRGGGARRVRTLVEVGALASVGALVFGLALHAGAVAVVLATVVFGLGALGWNALVYVSAGERVDPALAGRSVAVAATVVFVLSGIATPLLGALVDGVGWDVLWVVTASSRRWARCSPTGSPRRSSPGAPERASNCFLHTVWSPSVGRSSRVRPLCPDRQRRPRPS